MYKELKQEIDNKIIEISQQISKLSQSTHDWLKQSSNLLKLANRAKKLFLKGSKGQKLKLLNSVSSNRILKARKVHYTYEKPFDILAKTGERMDWLPASYELRTFFVQNVVDFSLVSA